jgi:preprotein translocase subunit SecE
MKNRQQGSVAKTSVNEFRKQVQAETTKVSWPSRAETVQTAIMVMIMAAILAVFFFVVDTAIGAGVKALLKLVS